MMHKIADLSQDNKHRTPEFTWKIQIGKNQRVTRKSTTIERLQGEENLTSAIYNSSNRFIVKP